MVTDFWWKMVMLDTSIMGFMRKIIGQQNCTRIRFLPTTTKICNKRRIPSPSPLPQFRHHRRRYTRHGLNVPVVVTDHRWGLSLRPIVASILPVLVLVGLPLLLLMRQQHGKWSWSLSSHSWLKMLYIACTWYMYLKLLMMTCSTFRDFIYVFIHVYPWYSIINVCIH